MKNEFGEALASLEKDKGIKKDYILDALKTALVHAYKKNYKEDKDTEIEIRMDENGGNVKVIAKKLVVEEYNEESETSEILLEDAKKLKARAKVGDMLEMEILPKNFGHIAAQTAKQIILQKIREAEREQLIRDFNISTGDIINGTVDRIERVEFRPKDGIVKADAKPRYNVIVNIGKVEAHIPTKGQTPGEAYTHGQKITVFVADINNTPRGPYVQVSRTAPELVSKLFEREVPEIKEGIVEIKSVSREAGVRSKIAVLSNEADVEPVGACVGTHGNRVNLVVEELGGEKVDIVKYSESPEEFIAAAISPAKAISVTVDQAAFEEGRKEAEVIVDESQLSLAIGKEGHNAKLAARLTGWKIDIKSGKSEADGE